MNRHGATVLPLFPKLAPASPSAPTDGAVVLQPRRGFGRLQLDAVVEYRDLLGILAMRDIRIRYKQTALGVLWAVIQPLVLMVVFKTFLGRYTGMTDPIQLYAGLLPWTLFAAAVTASAGSLVNNAQLLGKVYFPRIILPLASFGAPIVDFAMAFLVLLGMMAVLGAVISPALLLLPLLIASTILAAAGIGVLLAALTVSYRDFRYVVPFLVQVWFFVTPVIYHVPATYLKFNPMGGVIAAFRDCVIGEPIDYASWLCSTLVAAVVLVVGLMVFAKTERKFADVV